VFVIPNPQRWDITSPKLYTAKTIVRMGDKIVDNDSTTFAFVNSCLLPMTVFILMQASQLQGVCLHHDHGALGAAFNTRAMEGNWRLCVIWAQTPSEQVIIRLLLNCSSFAISMGLLSGMRYSIMGLGLADENDDKPLCRIWRKNR